jgi:hypothetical protein
MPREAGPFYKQASGQIHLNRLPVCKKKQPKDAKLVGLENPPKRDHRR